ncbi:MAG: CcmD family protein [Chitinophagaceae bacterium]
MTKKIFLLLTCLYMALPVFLQAQVTDPQKQYTAFDMRHNGKIYVVVTVILIIFTGLVLYLIRLDRKITKLEKENK